MHTITIHHKFTCLGSCAEVNELPLFTFRANTSHDVWQFGIVIFVCLTGCLPWQKATQDDPRFSRYLSWHSSSIPLKRQPKLFKLVSSKAQKFFKRYLEPRPERRPVGLAEVHRFLDDRWLSKGMEKTNEIALEEEGLCPSMYSFHSSPEEKNKLLFTLTKYGIETTVDRCAKKDRIRQWIQASVIEEENEEDAEDEEQTEEVIGIRDNETGPPGERLDRGPVQNTPRTNKDNRRMSVVSINRSEGTYVPPIDPRIPLKEQINNRRMSMDFTNGNNNTIKQNGDVIKHENQKNNENKDGKDYSMIKALPFQNVIVNGRNDSLDSDQSTDSGNTIKHNINIQIPQSEMYNCSLSPTLPPRTKKHVTLNINGRIINGDNNRHASSPKNRKHFRDEDKYAHYNTMGYKSSSSNSAST